MKERPIIFFDGVCNLCNSFVRMMIKIDAKDRLAFASLQGETAKEKLTDTDSKGLSSVVLYRNGQMFKESRAVIEALSIVGGPWKIFMLFKFVPPFIRDSLYRFVARNRYRWFGKKDEVCPLPTKKQREKVLP